MSKSTRELYQHRVDCLRKKIESLQRSMNKYANDNHEKIEYISIKQSITRVEMKIYERKIQIINERYGKAAIMGSKNKI